MDKRKMLGLVVYIRKVKKSESKSQQRIRIRLNCDGCVYP